MTEILDFVRSTITYLENLTNFEKIDPNGSWGKKYSERDMLYTSILTLAKELLGAEDDAEAIGNIYKVVRHYANAILNLVEGTEGLSSDVLAAIDSYTVAVISADYFLTIDHDVQASLLQALRIVESVEYYLQQSDAYVAANAVTPREYLSNVVTSYMKLTKALNFISEEDKGLHIIFPQKSL